LVNWGKDRKSLASILGLIFVAFNEKNFIILKFQIAVFIAEIVRIAFLRLISVRIVLEAESFTQQFFPADFCLAIRIELL
jgi:hypothetical protein